MSNVAWYRSLSSLVMGLVVVLVVAGCGGSDAVEEGPGPLRISAIPDVDPSDLAEREEALAAYLADELDVEVEYVPVSDYAASVSLFGTGDLDLVFYGGLTGVQARLRTEGANVLAQRDIDEHFRSVVIAHADAGLEPIEDVDGLKALQDTRFIFGSESSISGRLMPAYFLGEGFTENLRQALLDLDGSDPEEVELLEMYGAEAIVPAEAADHDQIEEIARTLGLVQ